MVAQLVYVYSKAASTRGVATSCIVFVFLMGSCAGAATGSTPIPRPNPASRLDSYNNMLKRFGTSQSFVEHHAQVKIRHVAKLPTAPPASFLCACIYRGSTVFSLKNNMLKNTCLD